VAPSAPVQADVRFMREALAAAAAAASLGEVPIGAVIVREGRVIARGENRRERDRDPTAHAEMIAFREAARHLGGWRLTECTLYVTLEPCAMCAGAAVQARLPRLVFGAADPKGGAGGSVVDLLRDARFSHTVEVAAGVCEDECGALLRRFFATLRGPG
jgi:tRNA(Arg) A34 adenosine deaminase TadA